MRWGNMRRLHPFSTVYGFERGRPTDRYYVEEFLRAHASDIRGHVLEIADDGYTRTFGGARVTRSDVLHASPGNPRATLVGDLATGKAIPSRTFDCMIVTQTYQFIYDVKAAVANSRRALKPGGVLLATVPGITRIIRQDMDLWGEYWRFTGLSARLLFEEVFPPGCVSVEAYGNLLASVAFLYGLAAEELRTDELDYRDADYELLIGVRAVAPAD